MGLFDWIRDFFRRLFGRRQTTPKPAPQPVPEPTTSNPWVFVNCVRMPPYPTIEGDWVSFELAEGRQVDMVGRKQSTLAGATRLLLDYTFDGPSIRPTEGTVARVSLMFMKAGATWGDQGDEVNGRWYSDAFVAIGVTGGLDVPLLADQWHNVRGHKNTAKFDEARLSVGMILVAFGDPESGATAHGVQGRGKLRFRLRVV